MSAKLTVLENELLVAVYRRPRMGYLQLGNEMCRKQSDTIKRAKSLVERGFIFSPEMNNGLALTQKGGLRAQTYLGLVKGESGDGGTVRDEPVGSKSSRPAARVPRPDSGRGNRRRG